MHIPPEPEPSADGDLLMQCLASENSDRTEVLARLCAAHPARADSLRQLFGLLDEYGLLVEPAPETRVPDRFGPYRVLEVLGSGGMGVVYLAEHEELGRRVALKVIHGALADKPKARERFRREALAAARLDHAGICPVYEVGSAEGVPFLAMRRVPGESLQQVIARGRAARADSVELPRREGDSAMTAILRFVERSASALHEAHEAGLVHRDVKPGNLLVTTDGAPVLVDFGLALLEDSDDDALTRTGDQLGTPSYMAPEQVSGQLVDRRADVHALGVVLYECLTLRLPFDAPNRHDLQSQILHDEPPDPRRASRAIGRDLCTVLQTALAKEPGRRYHTAAALAEDLRRVRMHEPILAQRAGRLLRLRRFAQRNPVAAGFLVFLLVAVIAFAVLLDTSAKNLRTSNANELALRAREYGVASPRRGLESALGAVELARTVDTVSALHSAIANFREDQRLKGHGASVFGARFSPDGSRILTWSDDSTARLWDRDGRQIAKVDFDMPTYWGEFGRDGRFVVTSADGTAKVCGKDGQHLHVLVHGATPAGLRDKPRYDPTIGAWVRVARWSPDGKYIATTCSDRHVRVWDSATGELLGEPFRHEGPLHFVAWSPDSTVVASAEGYDHFLPDTDRFAVRIWRPGPHHHEELPGFEVSASLHTIDFAPDGKALVGACDDGNAYIWDLGAPPAPARALPHDGAVKNARYAPNGDRILTGTMLGEVVTWSPSGERLHEARHDGAVLEAVFGAEGRRILTASLDQSVRVFDADLRELVVLRGHSELVLSVDLSPDGRQVVSTGWEPDAVVWNLVDSALPRFFGHTGRVRALAHLADGNIVSASDDHTVRFWHPDGTMIRVLPVAAPAATLALPPSGTDANRILVGHDDTIARLYERSTGKLLAEFPDHGGRFVSAVFLGDGRVLTSGYGKDRHAFAPDGTQRAVWGTPRAQTYVLARARHSHWIAAAGWGPNLSIWNTDGERLAHFHCSNRWSNAVAFSPQEDMLAVGSSDGVARIWRLRAGAPIEPEEPFALRDHTGRVMAVAWSPDGALLATGDSDGSVHLWNVASGERRAVLRGHGGSAVNALLFLSENRLLSAADDGAIQTWTTSTEELIELAKERLDR